MKIAQQDALADVILFGSRARNTPNADSDWDFLILTNDNNVSRQKEQFIRHALLEIEIETGQPISVFVISKSDWENKYLFSPFYKNIIREGKLLE